MTKAMLGEWEDATHDICLAAKLDFDEEINLELKKFEHNVHKLRSTRKGMSACVKKGT